ncbi:MAG: hypothetical protein NTX26_03435 [Candidatus Parcubacteria bacterium]|nr:hypothetical protein [Candidatus Parcubacteria bacterium]
MANKPQDEFDAMRIVEEAIKSFSPEEQSRIIKVISEKLGIFIKPEGQDVVENKRIMDAVQDKAVVQNQTKDIKTFIEAKNPRTDKEFATVVAYYYQFESLEKKDSISKKDLIEATRLADWERLSRPDQTLVNATNSGLLDNISRGQYRINSVGENLVAMTLPNSENTRIKKIRILPKRKVILNSKKA